MRSEHVVRERECAVGIPRYWWDNKFISDANRLRHHNFHWNGLSINDKASCCVQGTRSIRGCLREILWFREQNSLAQSKARFHLFDHSFRADGKTEKKISTFNGQSKNGKPSSRWAKIEMSSAAWLWTTRASCNHLFISAKETDHFFGGFLLLMHSVIVVLRLPKILFSHYYLSNVYDGRNFIRIAKPPTQLWAAKVFPLKLQYHHFCRRAARPI